MRRYWTGTTDLSKPRPAPSIWPMPFHQSVGELDHIELLVARWTAGRKKP